MLIFPLLTALIAAAPPSPVLVVLDGWVIATHDANRWADPDRDRICSAKSIQLYDRASGAARTVTCASEDEHAPGSVFLQPAGELGAGVLELSAPARAPARKSTALPLDSKVYRKVADDAVKKKKLPAILWDVERIDLDGDGTDEVLLIASSRSPKDTRPKRGDDWALAAIRYVEGEKPKLVELIRHDKTGEQLGPAEIKLRGILDVDGDGVLELVLEDRDPWGIGMEVWRFNKGKAEKLAGAGMGE